MRCPICRKPVTWQGNPYRPFCSERCKLLDLDNWLSERYRISTPVETRDKSDAASSTIEQDQRDRD